MNIQIFQNDELLEQFTSDAVPRKGDMISFTNYHVLSEVKKVTWNIGRDERWSWVRVDVQ